MIDNANAATLRWEALWKRLGVADDRRPSIGTVFARYSDPPRAYHNLKHIGQCLDELGAVRSLATDADAVELAIWYHDIIYDATRHDNEEQSAAVAASDLKSAGLSEELIEAVNTLILATRHTTPPATSDEQLLIDIDLSILGRTEKEFDEYERAIRQEYAFVDEFQFREGRRKILQRFLDRPVIFGTPTLREKFESTARRNLRRSIGRP